LQSDDLFFDRSESPDLQMLWLLVKAARDYVASVDMRDWDRFLEGGIMRRTGEERDHPADQDNRYQGGA
jgi:hypothetical protein